MDGLYIKCSDPQTIQKFRDLGFVVLSEKNGIVTFLNEGRKAVKFSDARNVTYTNKMEM